eukprot:TRINITY_DN28082_c0_g1_i1.p1 TRINITY_DN28082_c0_g1~~TRINITY_DN28082_c0_g1_i1.p1  ORF type:complete len:176 (+),score=53.02 TRINITY_DN28082_c0_g1_i1:71-529(+)
MEGSELLRVRRARARREEGGLGEDDRRHVAATLADDSERQLAAWETGVCDASGAPSKRRKIAATAGGKRTAEQEAFEKRWGSQQARYDVEKLLKENAEDLPRVSVPKSRAPRLCCWCSAPAPHHCRRCLRGYCSAKCRDLHKENLCTTNAFW